MDTATPHTRGTQLAMAPRRTVATSFVRLAVLVSAVSSFYYLVRTSENQLSVDRSTQMKVSQKEGEQEERTRVKELRTDVVFLKTHKTASSTFQNILLRFGEKHNLTFALPINGHQFSYPHSFLASYVAPLPAGAAGGRFHILCSHMRFNGSEVSRVMSPNATYLSIVRRPETNFESVFDYFEKVEPVFSAARIRSDRDHRDPFRTFLENAETLYEHNRNHSSFGKNPMAFDFGLNPDAKAWSREFRSGLARLDATFDLVMITERFDESVILAKELLGWETEDVVYLSNNKRAKTQTNGSSERRDPRLSEMIRRWNALDVALYEHFSRRFQRQVEAFGAERMRREVDALRGQVRALRQECVAGEVGMREIEEMQMIPYAPVSVDILGFNMKGGLEAPAREHCLRLLLPEPNYHSRLFRTQLPFRVDRQRPKH